MMRRNGVYRVCAGALLLVALSSLALLLALGSEVNDGRAIPFRPAAVPNVQRRRFSPLDLLLRDCYWAWDLVGEAFARPCSNRFVEREQLRSPMLLQVPTVTTRPMDRTSITPRGVSHPDLNGTSLNLRRTISLVVPLHQAGFNLTEQLEYLACALESKVQIERLMVNESVSIQIVLDTTLESTKELRTLLPALKAQCYWLDSIRAQQDYKATASRQLQWLRQRYPDDDPAVVTTEATLNVGNGRWKEVARHLDMLLKQQQYAPSTVFAQTLRRPSSSTNVVSLPFLVSTGRRHFAFSDTSSIGSHTSQVDVIQQLFLGKRT